jgi:hypothetical protein
MNELLDKQTLAAVIAASPVLPGVREEARELLACMRNVMEMDVNEVASVIVQDLASALTVRTGEVISAQAVGRLLREMGLSGQRTRDGYRYYWTSEQFSILDGAINGSDKIPPTPLLQGGQK